MTRANLDLDGRAVTLRPIEPGDAPALRRAFAELSPISRYRRFQRDLTEMSEETARYLTHVDGVSHLAFVALHVSPDLKDERIVGVARAIRLAPPVDGASVAGDVAEIAVTVADDFQGRGLGRHLLQAIGDAATRKGIRAFRAEVLASNEPAARALDTLVPGTREGETLVYEVPLDGKSDTRSDRSVFARFVRLAASPIGRAFRSLR